MARREYNVFENVMIDIEKEVDKKTIQLSIFEINECISLYVVISFVGS